MSKLYKAIDSRFDMECSWLVNDFGVAVTPWMRVSVEDKIRVSKELEAVYPYANIKEFEEYAINPILIAQW